MNNFIEVFDIHEKYILNQTIFKKYFYDADALKKPEKNIIKKYIDNIKLVTLLKPETIKIPSYEDENVKYLEIALIEINLLKNDKLEEITKILNKMVQYPIALFFLYEESVTFSLCEKRLDKVTNNNNIIENTLVIENINNYSKLEDYYISLMYLNNMNLYKYYLDLYAKTYALKLSKEVADFESLASKKLDGLKEINERIENINNSILNLKNKIKKEDAINRRIDLNVRLKKEGKKKIKLIEKIRGE